ncbi:MAG: hypothetical protein KGH62_06095, partial [Candidatus Micrarchaeota archaeon]|nr:hypothetical protein [Candidatus Micrarchaeota archaeon]
MDLCSTYIDGFDPLVGGGFTRGSVVLVSGGPGTGKTIFGLQFLYNGAMHAEPGLFLCTESTPDALRQEGASLGYDLQKLEQIDKIRFLQLPFDRSKFSFLRDVADEARKIGAKRIVFDSLATMYIRLGRFLPLWGRETDLIADQSTQAAERIIETMNKMAVSHSIIEQLRAIGTTTLVSTFGSN